MYHDDKSRPPPCRWCGERNDNRPYALCIRCEADAKNMKAARGEPIR